MPRPATGARERILDTTITLLREGGLQSAGLAEVVARGGAPRGSLYHYFPQGKVQLVEAALLRYEPLVAALIEAPLRGRGRLPTRVRALCVGIAERMRRSGWRESCAVAAVALDLGDEDGRLRQACAAIVERWSVRAAAVLPELAHRPAAVRRRAGRALVTMLEGAQTLARVRRDAAPLREAADMFCTYVDHLAQTGTSPRPAAARPAAKETRS